jgi:glycosyltransferase involved in cell wall biosynthesis
LGFGGGNNYAAKVATGKYLVFLNDDTTLGDGWLSHLVSVADASEDIGAVGSRILFPDGTLQEAGAILWSDGSCHPVGRGFKRGSINYTYRRDVHFVSANGLLVRKDAFERAGGFDKRYFPAYYEDVDLCLTLRHRLGLRVVYEPGSIIFHHESMTAKRDPEFRDFLFQRNRELLCEKWRKDLPYYPAPQPESRNAIESAIRKTRGGDKRALVLDDRVPQAGLGSGFGRTADMLADLAESGYAVDFIPTDRGHIATENLVGSLGVAVIPEALSEHLATVGPCYDIVIVSRPHNYNAHYPALRSALPGTPIIYDAEALYHRRIFLQAQCELDASRRESVLEEAEEMQALEVRIARSADAVVAISDSEFEWFSNLRSGATFFMRPLARSLSVMPACLEQRHGALLVCGWLAGEGSPNVQALRWYVQHVVPLIKKMLPGFVTRVTGSNPPLSVQRLESESVILTGFAPSMDALYRTARLAVAPLLTGAGVKIKTIEALQYGVPVVATPVGAEGLAVTDRAEIDISADPAEFASRVVALATDDDLWYRRREVIAKTLAVWESERVGWGELLANVLMESEAAPR